ncbi:OsmC family protein [Nocardioides jiangxiensis]|uniref:OsmC family protein n=1 Tax=Nocardioides jiangxiensis TaxID=3064524 RepID=A0ABT9B387_9ACTN|nr:OsmC family protein [Nocardioides sp. WY-20]MDO7869274.1 OsmC family protein [Nocardioides sp. WY-20]
MDAAALREAQSGVKARYRNDPASASTTISAVGDWSEPGITATIEGFAGPVRAGLHTATGGDGSDACSGDMLMQALLGCAGVTMRSVATAMGIVVRRAELVAESSFDARGTLGLDRSVPVGIGPVTVTAVLDTDADEAQLAKLAELTGRYCVVGRSLVQEPTIEIRRAGRRAAR